MAFDLTDPYSQYRNGPQQNVNNAQLGGTQSVQNATTQTVGAKAASNPYADFLNHVRAFNSLQKGNEQPGLTDTNQTVDQGGQVPFHHPNPVTPPVNTPAPNGGIDMLNNFVPTGQIVQPPPQAPAPAPAPQSIPQQPQVTQTPPPPQFSGNATPVDLSSYYNNAFQDALKQIQGMLQPEFSYEANQLNRNMAAGGAATGNINSGGYQESLGRAQSQLAANQGSRLSDYVTTASEAAKNRALQQFGMQLADDTQRYGINTNAQLQMYMQGQANALQKYGIDTNALMDQYKAQLQLKGIEYSADKQFDADAMRSAIQLELGRQGYDVQRENNLLQFILGNQSNEIAGINAANGVINGTPAGNIFVKP